MANQNSYPPLSAPMLERLLLEEHKEAGKLSPGQHVYTIEGMQKLLRIYGIHIGKVVIESKGNDKNKREKITRINSKVLDQACNNYRELNKTK